MGQIKDHSPPYPVLASGQDGYLGRAEEQTSTSMSPPHLSAPTMLNAVVRQGTWRESRPRPSMEVPFKVNFKTAVGHTNGDLFKN